MLKIWHNRLLIPLGPLKFSWSAAETPKNVSFLVVTALITNILLPMATFQRDKFQQLTPASFYYDYGVKLDF